MKHSIIKEIFYGNRGASDSFTMPEEYRRKSKESLKKIDEFSQALNEEQRAAFNAILDKELDIGGDAEEAFFVEAMKIGIRLGGEAFDD